MFPALIEKIVHATYDILFQSNCCASSAIDIFLSILLYRVINHLELQSNVLGRGGW